MKQPFTTFIPFILFLTAFASCFIDGPDVISEDRANEKFGFAIRTVLHQIDPYSAIQFNPVHPRLQDPQSGCQREIFFFKDAVDECETLIYSIRGSNVPSIIEQYFVVRFIVCDLQPVPFYNNRTPMQGEIDLCRMTGL